MTEAQREPSREPVPDPHLRVSDADRDAVAERLREAAGEGRIDLEELDERLERALTARTYADLAPLTADLPGPVAPPERPPTVVKGGFHGGERTGRWEVPREIEVHGGMGGVKLDFCRADCPYPEVTVAVQGDMGGVQLVLPEGWGVDPSGLDPALGGLKNRLTADRAPGAPLLRLTGSAGIGGVRVRHPNRWERRRLRSNPA
jgi:hypothetical protein